MAAGQDSPNLIGHQKLGVVIFQIWNSRLKGTLKENICCPRSTNSFGHDGSYVKNVFLYHEYREIIINLLRWSLMKFVFINNKYRLRNKI
jgi:hypothetical protein